MALGGMGLETIEQVKDMNFGGVVIMGDIWTRFNVFQTQDFKELIAHFRKLKKATL
jgi:thiamine-phosphate pyrophosphorylase